MGPFERNSILKLAVVATTVAQLTTFAAATCYIPTPYGTYCNGSGNAELCNAGYSCSTNFYTDGSSSVNACGSYEYSALGQDECIYTDAGTLWSNSYTVPVSVEITDQSSTSTAGAQSYNAGFGGASGTCSGG